MTIVTIIYKNSMDMLGSLSNELMS